MCSLVSFLTTLTSASNTAMDDQMSVQPRLSIQVDPKSFYLVL